MIGLLQRVREARVDVEGATIGRIGAGLLVLVCAERGDTAAEADRLLAKLLKLRVFSDAAGKMNQSVQDVGGGLLVVSQFTLAADTRGGNRPSFTQAAAPEEGWLVLGDMRELGPDAEALHAQAGLRARAAGLKRLYALGPLSAAAAVAFGEGGRHFATHDALSKALQDELHAGVRCLVKGSRGSAMDLIVKALLAQGEESPHVV